MLKGQYRGYIYNIYPSWKHVSIFFVITRTFSFVFLSFEYPWAIHGCHGLRVRRFESDFKLEQVRTGYHGSIEMVPSLRDIFSLCRFFSQVFLRFFGENNWVANFSSVYCFEYVYIYIFMTGCH